jgi:AHBA synthesis associated protein
LQAAAFPPSSRRCLAVIFDLDGVLIDSSRVMEQAFSHAWRQFFDQGQPPFAQYQQHMGKGFGAIMDAMGLPRAMAVPFRERSAELADQIDIFPGVHALLEALRAEGLYLGLSTGKESDRTDYILRRLGLRNYFGRVVCSDQVKQGKPHPESAWIHLREAGVAPSQAMFIGDARADIECARRAEVPSVAVLWGMGREADLRAERPDHMVRDFGELHCLLLRCARAALRPARMAPALA